MFAGSDRANGAIAMVVLVGAVVGVAAIAGYVGMDHATDADGANGAVEPTTTTAANATTEAPSTVEAMDNVVGEKSVQVVFEQWQDEVTIAIRGGDDAGNVTEYTITGADVDGTLDPDADYPKVHGTVDAPTTVVVKATFEDGTTAVVGKLTVGANTTTT